MSSRRILYSKVVEVTDACGRRTVEMRSPRRPCVPLSSSPRRRVRRGGYAFMHAFRHPAHERKRAIAREIASSGVVSHEVSPLSSWSGAGDTTVVDAYLSPILRRYVAQVEHELDRTHRGAADVHDLAGA